MPKRMDALNEESTAFIQSLYPGEDKALVYGCGKTDAPVLMLIGEAPGEQEVLQKRPFVGKAGRNLDELLAPLHLSREDIYITNAVKIRPTAVGRTGRVRNRAPGREEIALFQPWLEKEIALVQPKLLVTLGNVPLKALLDGGKTVGECHGECLHTKHGAPLFCLYHPAAIIYRRELKEIYRQDVDKLYAVISAQ